MTPSEIMQSLLLPYSSHAYSCGLISMSKKLLERCETRLIICDTMKVIFYLLFYSHLARWKAKAENPITNQSWLICVSLACF